MSNGPAADKETAWLGGENKELRHLLLEATNKVQKLEDKEKVRIGDNIRRLEEANHPLSTEGSLAALKQQNQELGRMLPSTDKHT